MELSKILLLYLLVHFTGKLMLKPLRGLAIYQNFQHNNFEINVVSSFLSESKKLFLRFFKCQHCVQLKKRVHMPTDNSMSICHMPYVQMPLQHF